MKLTQSGRGIGIAWSSLAILVAALSSFEGTARATSDPGRSETQLTVMGQCVTTGSADPPTHAGVYIVPCNASDDTQWNLLETNGEIMLGGGQCLDLPSSDTADGTHLQAYPCSGAANQQFQWNVGGSLTVLGKCLDLPGGNTASGTPLQIYDCNGGENQSFNFVTLAPGQVETQANTTKCVDVPSGDTANGTLIQLYDCNASFPSNQVLQFMDDGTIQVLGKCLDVPGGDTANGTLIQLYDCNGGDNQQFVYAADDTLRVLGKCLDLPGGSTADHTEIQIYTCSGDVNQRWWLSPNSSTCVACNDGTCQCGTGGDLCASHEGQSTTLGCAEL